ncbi:hypothetical protein BL253_18365 [Pseudofrankia asymbiotica]|uniref:Uncharacterized protein n=1 Tax=Pseudofrankia asymbiotica TaxID=1834516 RepID=A0A1V2IAY1_9ACTN|nr:hypothetical protein BL253_18365 [Pseudofrankia asymbiotica]
MLLVGATLLLTGCGSAGDPGPTTGPDAGTTVSSSPATAVDGGRPPSTASPATGASHATTTPPVSGTSNDPASGGSSRAKDDVDGDGRPDQLSLSGGGVLTARYAAGGRDQVSLGQGVPGDQELLGTADANGDGRAEVFVRVVMGANAQIVTMLRQVNGHLVRMSLDEQPSSLSSGGGGRNLFNWACEPDLGNPGAGQIVTWFAGSEDDGQTLQGEVRRYDFVGDALVVTYQEPFSIRADDPIPGIPVRPGCDSIPR